MAKRYRTAEVYGMCGGVFAALKMVEKAVSECGNEPLYVLHELVHNRMVTAGLEACGVKFADSVSEIPQGAKVLIGAHGVSVEVEKELRKITDNISDATCPLVKKLQVSAAGLTEKDDLVIFGKHRHPEVEGVAGHSRAGRTFIVSNEAEIDELPELHEPFFISQTTVDAAKSAAAAERLCRRFSGTHCMSGVCDASARRQAAVRKLAKECQLIIVAGSAHSSNACRLRELAEEAGCRAFLTDEPQGLPVEVLKEAEVVGLTSGASTPEKLFSEIVKEIEKLGFTADRQ